VSSTRREVITLGGGCFWCLDAVFTDIKGVEQVLSGYSGGRNANPTYEDVCTGATGHAEVVQITFDPAVVPLRELLHIFFTLHDPTTKDRQGNDVGTQYRSAIYWFDDAQRAAAEASRDMYAAQLKASGHGEITTEIEKAGPFYYAEDYHQQYLHKNPGGYCGLGGTGVSCPVGLGASLSAADPASSAGE
jgi:peptide-methionine (S)-S-oxide reductase